jgi:hypothetical protein
MTPWGVLLNEDKKIQLFIHGMNPSEKWVLGDQPNERRPGVGAS